MNLSRPMAAAGVLVVVATAAAADAASGGWKTVNWILVIGLLFFGLVLVFRRRRGQ